MMIDGGTLLPLGMVLGGFGTAISVGVIYGRMSSRMGTMEEWQRRQDAEIAAAVAKLNSLELGITGTLAEVQAEQKSQRELLENINSWLKQNAKLH